MPADAPMPVKSTLVATNPGTRKSTYASEPVCATAPPKT